MRIRFLHLIRFRILPVHFRNPPKFNVFHENIWWIRKVYYGSVFVHFCKVFYFYSFILKRLPVCPRFFLYRYGSVKARIRNVRIRIFLISYWNARYAFPMKVTWVLSQMLGLVPGYLIIFLHILIGLEILHKLACNVLRGDTVFVSPANGVGAENFLDLSNVILWHWVQVFYDFQSLGGKELSFQAESSSFEVLN